MMERSIPAVSDKTQPPLLICYNVHGPGLSKMAGPLWICFGTLHSAAARSLVAVWISTSLRLVVQRIVDSLLVRSSRLLSSHARHYSSYAVVEPSFSPSNLGVTAPMSIEDKQGSRIAPLRNASADTEVNIGALAQTPERSAEQSHLLSLSDLRLGSPSCRLKA